MSPAVWTGPSSHSQVSDASSVRARLLMALMPVSVQIDGC